MTLQFFSIFGYIFMEIFQTTNRFHLQNFVKLQKKLNTYITNCSGEKKDSLSQLHHKVLMNNQKIFWTTQQITRVFFFKF